MSKDNKGGDQGAGADEAQKKLELEKSKEKPIGEIIDEAKGDGKPKGETVPIATFLDLKRDNKEMREAISNLEKQVADGKKSDIEDASADLAEIALELGADPKKLQKAISDLVAKKTAESIKPFQDAEKKIQEREGELSKKQRDEHVDKVFKDHFDAAMERMPDYKDIANADVIKTLSLLPQNATKTFTQLIEETYGNAIDGKRSIATEKKPGGGKDPEPLDVARAKRDTAYFNEIMADPEKKKQYNEQLTKVRP